MADGQLSTVLRQLRHLVAGRAEDERTDGQLLDAFLERRDEAAFASLVRRHGPMVLGVCRHILADAHAAEDAFQATFLVLFRRARVLDRRGSLAGWLYTVAYHAALKARASMARRQRHEKLAAEMNKMVTSADALWDDLRPVLDEEMNALPEKYRLPVLLCYLEGKTNTEAARLLGWPAGTVKGRLSRARELLRQRLTRRGIPVPAVVLGVALGEHAAVAMPSVLVESTVHTVVMASGNAALATPAAKLAASVLRGMAASRIQVATLVLLGLTMLGLGGGIWARQALRPAENRPTTFLAQTDAERPMTPALQPVDLSRPMAVRGRVIGPDGKPVPHARLTILVQPGLPGRVSDFSTTNPETLKELTADAAGRFAWRGRRAPFGAGADAFLLAKADGFGLTWIHLRLDDAGPAHTVRLAPERVLHGRLFDLKGQPAARVRLEFSGLGVVQNGNFDGVRTYGAARLGSLWSFAALFTDSDGRFAVRGFDGRQNVGFDVRDRRFAMQGVTIPASESTTEVTKVLAPAQTIEGTVRAEDTGKPLPHARLAIHAGQSAADGFMGMTAAADANGHFSINPWSGNYFMILAYPPDGTPYLIGQKKIKWSKGAVKTNLDLRLPRGVLVRGKITEAASGRPVARANVQYWPRTDNKSPLRARAVTDWQGSVVSGSDGTFAIAVLPGPGTLLVSGPTPDFIHDDIGSNQLYRGKPGGRHFYPDAVVKLDLSSEAQQKDVAIKLRRGVTVGGSIVGPKGEAVDEAVILWRLCVAPLRPEWYPHMKVIGNRFELRGLGPDQHYTAYFLDPKNRNGAAVEVSGQHTGQPLTVRLQRCGQATIRFVNQHGKSLAGQRPMLFVIVRPGASRFDPGALSRGELDEDSEFVANIDRVNYKHKLVSGPDGRFALPALIPGCTYRIQTHVRQKDRYRHPEDWRPFRVQSGQTLDLGDIVVEQ